MTDDVGIVDARQMMCCNVKPAMCARYVGVFCMGGVGVHQNKCNFILMHNIKYTVERRCIILNFFLFKCNEIKKNQTAGNFELIL